MKITLNDVTNIDALSVINDNFDKIEQELQNKVLYRNNPSGEPNSISNDIDMNGNDLLNVGDVVSVNGRWATIDEVEAIQDDVTLKASQVATNTTLSLGYRNSAESAWDNFDDRYLGNKTSDPSVDNDGNTLLTGALYFRTSGTPIMRVYNGTTWQDVGSIITTTTNLIDPTLYSSQAEAEAGVNNTKVITPLSAKQAIAAQAITKRWLTGEWVLFPDTTPPAGCVVPNGGTIGNASSGATTRANADTFDLFAFYWRLTNNTDYPIQDSAGAASTRGASAAADFAANKRFPLPNIQDGDALVAAVSSAVLSRTVGANLSHTHTITVDAVGDHSHTFAVTGGNGGTAQITAAGGQAPGVTSTNAAGGHTHTASANSSGGAKNLAAGLMTRVYIAL